MHFAEVAHLLRGVRCAEKYWSYSVDFNVEGLGGKDDGNEKSEGAGVVEKAVWNLGIYLLQLFHDKTAFVQHGLFGLRVVCSRKLDVSKAFWFARGGLLRYHFYRG